MDSLETKIEELLEKFYKNNNIDLDYIKYDTKLNRLNKISKEWIEGIAESDREAFLSLLSNFRYMTRLAVINKMRELFKAYKTIEPTYIDSIFIPVSSFGGVFNGAVNIVECFEEVLSEESELTKKSIPIDPRAYYNLFDLETVKNIVFIDDIIGSGDTFINFLYRISMELPELIDGRKLYLLSLFNLKKGINAIEKINELEWEITIINSVEENSVFEDAKIYSNQTLMKSHKTIVRKYEKLVNNDGENIYIMGYKKSAILLGLFYNTPNNTLSTFWKERENWVPLFPRKVDRHIYGIRNNNILDEIKNSKKEKLKRTEFIKLQIEKNKGGI